jgi:hypothetical protein
MSSAMNPASACESVQLAARRSVFSRAAAEGEGSSGKGEGSPENQTGAEITEREARDSSKTEGGATHPERMTRSYDSTRF